MVVCAVLVGLALVGFGSWLQAVGSLVLPVAAVATLRWRVLRRARRVNPGASGSQPALVGRVVAVPARDLEVIDLRDDDPSGDLNDVFGAGERRVHRDLEHRIAAAVVADADTRRAERRARRTGGRPELLPVDVPLPSFVLKPDAPARAKPLVIDPRHGDDPRHSLRSSAWRCRALHAGRARRCPVLLMACSGAVTGRDGPWHLRRRDTPPVGCSRIKISDRDLRRHCRRSLSVGTGFPGFGWRGMERHTHGVFWRNG
jgi:hypothetical protein